MAENVPKVNCPNCHARIVLLADSPKTRALEKLLRPELAVPSRTRRTQSAPPSTAAAPTPTTTLDGSSVRRAIYRKHGTDTAAAAEEWAKWQKDHPTAASQ